MDLKILMSNIAYAHGLNGTLFQHVRYAHRHLFCDPKVQAEVMAEVKTLIAREDPDICCLVEIERGGTSERSFNQLHALLDERYPFSDIAGKYDARSALNKLPVLSGKCNAFCAKRPFDFKHIYLSAGMKRLVYQITLAPELTLFFCHFSLLRATRAKQFRELRGIIRDTPGEHIIMGDFNIFGGIEELHPLLEGTSLRLLNNPKIPTFRFHRRQKLLDLCICTQRLSRQAQLRIIEQHYSDHCALLLHLTGFQQTASPQS